MPNPLTNRERFLIRSLQLVGAAALISYLVSEGFNVEALILAGVLIVYYAYSRLEAKALLEVEGENFTNPLIGSTVVALSDFSRISDFYEGRVSLNGSVWTGRLKEAPLESGQSAKVVSIGGHVLWLEL